MSTELAPSDNSSPHGEQYLSFFLGVEEYALGILAVQEIVGSMPITVVPRVAKYVAGVVNLRGKIISVIDLRCRFGMARAAATRGTCIVVVVSRGREVGLLVDRVSEVVTLAPGEIAPSPEFGVSVDTSYLLGVAKQEGRVRLILDIDRILATEEPARVPGGKGH